MNRYRPHGLTTRALARETGVDRRTVSAWMQGKREPRIGLIQFYDAVKRITGIHNDPSGYDYAPDEQAEVNRLIRESRALLDD